MRPLTLVTGIVSIAAVAAAAGVITIVAQSDFALNKLLDDRAGPKPNGADATSRRQDRGGRFTVAKRGPLLSARPQLDPGARRRV